MRSFNRTPIIYPKYVNLYLQCPERYFHEKVERREVDQAFSPALAKGIAVHEILAQAAYGYKQSFDVAPTIPCDLLARAERVLPRSPYPSELAWRADIEAVVNAAKVGLDALDGHARVLAVEATYQFPYLRGRDCPDFILAAKVDLVLLKHDENGRPFLDVVDYKGGSRVRSDVMQELAARIVVKQNARRFEVDYDHIQSTTFHLGAAVRTSQILDVEECGERWLQMKQVINRLLTGDEWKPNPSPLCEWCPFFNDGCSLTPESSQATSLGEWLDAAAGKLAS